MKGTSRETGKGSIHIDNEVIAQYAGSVAVECFGIVGMAMISVKDGIVRLLKGENLTQGIHVSYDRKGHLILDFHVIVSYGVSIQAISDNLLHSVRYKVEEFTGLKVARIRIHVEGVRVID